MPAEKFVHDFVKEAGYTPIPDRAIIVTYAPADLSEKIARFFSNEFFALQMCEKSLVLFSRYSFYLLPLGKVLIFTPVVFKVYGTAGEAVLRIGTDHGCVEGSKVCSSNQQCHYQHIPHGLPTLKFHHRYGDNVLILPVLSPAIYYCVEQKHRQSYQGWQIKKCIHYSGGIPVQLPNEKTRHPIPGKSADYHEGNTYRTIPLFYFSNRFGSVGLLDNVHDVCAANPTTSQQEQHGNCIDGKGQGKEVGAGIK